MKRSTQPLRGNSSLAIILKLLKESDSAMTVKELSKLVLEEKPLSGKTPERTISGVLQRSDRVVKVGKATYAINDKF